MLSATGRIRAGAPPEEADIARIPRSTTAAVLRFAAGGLAALVILAVGAVVVLRDTARDEAIRDAESTTLLIATAAITPALDSGILTLDPQGIAALDRVTSRLDETSLQRVKIWAADGTIVYSDDARLIGSRFALDDEEVAVLRSGGVDAGVSDLTDPENRYEPPDQPLVEVYTKVTTPDGTPLLFEAYYRDRDVAASASIISQRFVPVAVGALVVFALVQIPLGIRLARHMRAAQSEREALLRQVIDSQSNERRRIAADLHDGVVQDLAGVSFTIAAASDALADTDLDARISRSLDDAARSTRNGIQQLRTLLVDIYPPNLRAAGLPAALRDLLAPLRSAGITTDFCCPDELALDDDQEALLYRTAHEGLRNALRHARARNVVLEVERTEANVAVVVRDDGVGFDPSAAAPSDHFGLRALADVAAATDARLTIDSRPGVGTVLRLELGVPA